MLELVRAGYDREELLDMDHVSFIRTYDILSKVKAEDAATNLQLNSVAAQGDGDGIKKVHGSLMEAAGRGRPTDGAALRRAHG